jgi:hypothetical protein
MIGKGQKYLIYYTQTILKINKIALIQDESEKRIR